MQNFTNGFDHGVNCSRSANFFSHHPNEKNHHYNYEHNQLFQQNAREWYLQDNYYLNPRNNTQNKQFGQSQSAYYSPIPNHGIYGREDINNSYDRTVKLIQSHSKGRLKLPKYDHTQKKITSYFTVNSMTPNDNLNITQINDKIDSDGDFIGSLSSQKPVLSSTSIHHPVKSFSPQNIIKARKTSRRLQFDDKNIVQNIKIENKESVLNNKEFKSGVSSTYSEVYNYSKDCNISQLLVEFYSDRKSEMSSEFSPDLTVLFDTCMEERERLKALDAIESLICRSYYPQPQTLSSIIFCILECTDDEEFVNRASIILHRIFHLHPPGNGDLSQYYLDSFSICGKQKVSPWTILSMVIKKCISRTTDDSMKRNVKYSQYALSFMMDVIEFNFDEFLRRNKNTKKYLKQKNDLPIVAKIFWSTGEEVFVNKNCRELFQYLFELLDCPVLEDNKYKSLLLLQRLIGIVAEYCFLSDSQMNLNVSCSFCARDVVKVIYSILSSILKENDQMLKLFLDTTQIPWLKMLFCKSFLDEEMGLHKSNATPFSLQVIVKDYMHKILETIKRYSMDSQSPRRSKRSSIVKEQLATPDKSSSTSSKHSPRQPYSVITKRNCKGETRLHTACIQKGKEDKLRYLLSLPGVDVNVQDNAGWTPLHEACSHGRIECVKLLLEWSPPDNDKSKKVNLLAEGPEGRTPLHDAVMHNRLEIVELLLRHGGKELLESRTSSGLTPLVLSGNEEMTKLLASSLDDTVVKEIIKQEICTNPLSASKETETDIENSSETVSSENDLHKYLLLLYHLLTSYLVIYRVDEMVWELRKVVEEETHKSSFVNNPPNSAKKQNLELSNANIPNRTLLWKAARKVFSFNRTHLQDFAKKDLEIALQLPNIVDSFAQNTNTSHHQSNTILKVLKMLATKYIIENRNTDI